MNSTGSYRGISPARVAEVIVELDSSKPGRRGSGYRISTGVILTAAHVVAGAASVRVRFNADSTVEWTTPAEVVIAISACDMALLSIVPREDEPSVESSRFGRIADKDTILACTAVGFPRFKLRDHNARQLDDGYKMQ